MHSCAFIPASGFVTGWSCNEAAAVKQLRTRQKVCETRVLSNVRRPAVCMGGSGTAEQEHAERSAGMIDSRTHAGLETMALGVMAALLGFSDEGVGVAHAVPGALVEGFKSIPASLVHPLVMWLLVGTTLYTFNLGYQSRQIRNVGVEERKALVEARVTERHFKTSSLLFCLVTLATFGGMANTYTRADKLFPGAHLYAGLGIIAVMSVMTALVPYMQRGKNWARDAHLGAAVGVTVLFAWQAKSGMGIVFKLLKWD